MREEIPVRIPDGTSGKNNEETTGGISKKKPMKGFPKFLQNFLKKSLEEVLKKSIIQFLMKFEEINLNKSFKIFGEIAGSIFVEFLNDSLE